MKGVDLSTREWPHLACAAGAVTIAVAAVLPLHAQDFKGLLQQLIKPVQGLPNLPQAPTAVTNVLSGSSGAKAGDIAQLLTQSVEQIDEPKEVEIGRTLAAVLLGSKPLHPDMGLQRYVNRLGRWIALHSDRPDLKWTFGVLDDPGYNAFAAPGGYIVVTKGLIDRVADEAELAGILAHEITHVTSRHHLKAMNKNAQTSLGTQLLAQAAASKINNTVGKNLSSQVVALGRDLYSRGLDQGDELEADRNGVALATRAGFDPFGLVAVLQQLRSATPDNPIFSLSMSTHPAPQLRLDQLEQAMGKRLDAFAGQPVVTLAQRLGTR
ncbi:MAG: M48 family metalloprotease [Hylemonella sp.]|nr:M48 family metalloprotease [Hylemonella sp.]